MWFTNKECNGSSSHKVLDTVGETLIMSCLLEKTKVARKEFGAILPYKNCIVTEKIPSYAAIKAICDGAKVLLFYRCIT